MYLQTVRLAALLDEAKDRCKATIKARREERNEPISEEELESSSAIMGYAAVKYADLKNNRKTDYRCRPYKVAEILILEYLLDTQ